MVTTTTRKPRFAARRRESGRAIIAAAVVLAMTLAPLPLAHAAQDPSVPVELLAFNTSKEDVLFYVASGALMLCIAVMLNDDFKEFIDFLNDELDSRARSGSGSEAAALNETGMSLLLGELERRGSPAIRNEMIRRDSGWNQVNEKKTAIFLQFRIAQGRDSTMFETDADGSATVDLMGLSITGGDPLTGMPPTVSAKRVKRSTLTITDGFGVLLETFNSRKLRKHDLIVPVITRVKNDSNVQDVAVFRLSSGFEPAKGEPVGPRAPGR